jgi:hypothetical protein
VTHSLSDTVDIAGVEYVPLCCAVAAVAEAEQRVLQEAPVSVFAKAFHDGQSVGFDKGYTAALAAARDAVAALKPTTTNSPSPCEKKPSPPSTQSPEEEPMSEHDPLCERGNAPNYSTCYCYLIARVREDERAAIREPGRITLAIEDAYAKGRADALAEAREAVAAVPDARYEHWIRQAEALAAIDALRGER